MHILREWIILSYFPNMWKIAKVTPIPKMKKDQATNYRPISLLSSLGKIFEKVIQKRLNDHLSDNKIRLQTRSFYQSPATESLPIYSAFPFEEKFNWYAHV